MNVDQFFAVFRRFKHAYPTTGLAAALKDLGGPIGAACVTAVTNACLIDAVLANNGNPAGSGKSGYLFTTGAGTFADGVNVGCTAVAVPITADPRIRHYGPLP
jgi:hypothetical protein